MADNVTTVEEHASSPSTSFLKSLSESLTTPESGYKKGKSHSPKPESPTPPKGPSMLIQNVLRRRNSSTLPYKKSSKVASKSKTMKKRESMPVFHQTPGEGLNTSDEAEFVSDNKLSHQRPLPPSPPPSPDSSPGGALFPLIERGSEFPNHNSVNGADEEDNENRVESSEDKEVKDSSLQSLCGLVDNSEMPLKNALTKFNNHFPIQIKFLEGYCSEESEHSLSVNEVYDIQFMKKTRVITLKDKDGFRHHIPLASTMMFGMVYNPFNKYDKALAGYTFERCSDIMASLSMPSVVCATNSVHSLEEKHSIAENEILIVKGIQKAKLRGKRFLKVFSILTNSEKLLPEECEGNFATKPSLVRLHLPQIVNSIASPFPIQAVLYVDNQESSLKLSFPIAGVITLCECRVETSLVAYPNSAGQHTEDHITLHLNDDMMELGVKVLKWKGSSQNLLESEDHILEDGAADVDYDDVIVVQKKPTTSENETYDDIVVTSQRREVSDDETYATVDLHNNTSKIKPIDEAGYDKVSKEILLDPTSVNESLAL